MADANTLLLPLLPPLPPLPKGLLLLPKGLRASKRKKPLSDGKAYPPKRGATAGVFNEVAEEAEVEKAEEEEALDENIAGASSCTVKTPSRASGVPNPP